MLTCEVALPVCVLTSRPVMSNTFTSLMPSALTVMKVEAGTGKISNDSIGERFSPVEVGSKLSLPSVSHSRLKL